MTMKKIACTVEGVDINVGGGMREKGPQRGNKNNNWLGVGHAFVATNNYAEV